MPKHKVNRGQNLLTVIFSVPLNWCLFVCLQSCAKANSSSKTHQTKQFPKRNPGGGDGRRERGCSQPHLLYNFIIAFGVCICSGIVGAQQYM